MGSAWSDFKEAQDEETETVTSPIRSALSYSQEKEIAIWSLSVPKILLSELLAEIDKPTDFTETPTQPDTSSDSTATPSEILYEAFLKQGYAFIQIDNESLYSHLEKLINCGEKFFLFQKPNIKTQLSNPTTKNRGYHFVQPHREHLSLCKEDQGVIPDQIDEEQVSELFQPSALQKGEEEEAEKDDLPPPTFNLHSSQLLPISIDSSIFYTWPKYPSDFTASYNSAFNPLLEISFKIFKQVFSLMNKNLPNMIELKSALSIKSSLHLNHYLPPKLDHPHDPCLESNRVVLANGARRIYPLLDVPVEELKIVQAAHLSPSILTLSLVSEGFQVYDKSARAWVEVERVEKRGFVVTLGQKANMFFSSEEMESTPTRVVLKCGKEVFSCNFCLDLEL